MVQEGKPPVCFLDVRRRCCSVDAEHFVVVFVGHVPIGVSIRNSRVRGLMRCLHCRADCAPVIARALLSPKQFDAQTGLFRLLRSLRSLAMTLHTLQVIAGSPDPVGATKQSDTQTGLFRLLRSLRSLAMTVHTLQVIARSPDPVGTTKQSDTGPHYSATRTWAGRNSSSFHIYPRRTSSTMLPGATPALFATPTASCSS